MGDQARWNEDYHPWFHDDELLDFMEDENGMLSRIDFRRVVGDNDALAEEVVPVLVRVSRAPLIIYLGGGEGGRDVGVEAVFLRIVSVVPG